MSVVNGQFDGVRAQMQAAQDSNDLELIARLDKQFHNQLLKLNLEQLASQPEQIDQLKELLKWYGEAVASFTEQKNSLQQEINGRQKNILGYMVVLDVI